MADERELVHRIEIDAPISAVWSELTKMGARQRAMMDTVLDTTLAVGAPLYYRSEDGKRSSSSGGSSRSNRRTGWHTRSGS